VCILEEMQWIRTRPVHAADFFHGTLELIEDGVSVLPLKGEDAARPLAERVEVFVPRHGGLLTVLERVDAHLEEITGHPLTTRRYYKKVEY
jgi:fructoselysine-6-phosphate deglycase